jgi:hypothetical protein
MADGPLALCPQDARGLWDGHECVGDVNVLIAYPARLAATWIWPAMTEGLPGIGLER